MKHLATVGVVLAIASRFLSDAVAQEPPMVKLELPQPHQVVQRIGNAPGAGYALCLVRGELPIGTERGGWEYRVVTLASEPVVVTDWAKLALTIDGSKFQAPARVAAGGWYRLEVRCHRNGTVMATGAVEPVGVGDVFVVAGQSYATNCNDKRLKVTDAQSRAAAFDSEKGTWRVANDPQPCPDGSDGGSIWPPVGDVLAKELRVPIGFANVAVGGTSSKQWMPDGNLHPRLVRTGETLGRFRAVLWQQGESDVIAKTSLEQYVANLTTIREAAAAAWGFEPPWLLAKSTLHPTVYNDPEGEGRIRSAIDELLKRPGFKAGPDTDTLKGENRGDSKSRRHFSAIGQRNAAQMWLAVLRREILPEPPGATSLKVGVADKSATPPSDAPLDKAPEAAKAPFDARQARTHQEAWARHLRMPVETTNTIGGKLILIPPGEFLMGSSDADVAVALQLSDSITADQNTRSRIESTERPRHRVTITKPFLLGATEVTIGQFRKFVEATKYVTEAEKYGSANSAVTAKATTPQKEAFDWRWPGYNQVEEDAVSQVTWNDAVVFCNWLSEQERLAPCYQTDVKFGWALQPLATGYRLPTEAEWEYACRGGTTAQYSFGDELRDLEHHGWFSLKSGSKPSRGVGSKRPNPFGLFDMHGNVFEWCQDGFDAAWYEKSPHADPLAPPAPTRVMRSGDWFGNAVRCRSAFRGRGEQTTRSDDVGFRVVRSAGSQ